MNFPRVITKCEHSYSPGDVAVIYPQTAHSDVSEFLQTMHWQDVADDLFQFEIIDPCKSLFLSP